MIFQTVKNILFYVACSVVYAISFVVMSLLSNFLVFMEYSARYVMNLSVSFIIVLAVAFLLGRSSGVNLTAKGKFTQKSILITHLIAFTGYLLFSLAVMGVTASDIGEHSLSTFFYLSMFPGMWVNDAFLCMCISLPVVSAARLIGLFLGHKIILQARPDLAVATDFKEDGSFLDPAANKRSWRDSVR